MENRTVKERENLVDKSQGGLSVRKQCALLRVTRRNLYYQPKGESEENLKIMRLMDEIYIENPTYGVLMRMQGELLEHDIIANTKRVRRLMRLMGLEAIYPKPNLSKLGKAQYIHPYLLRNMKVKRPNHVWAIDITYIAMEKGLCT